MTETRTTVAAVTSGSGNVFADLALGAPDDLLAKARLASAVSDLIDDAGLTQTEAAHRLGTSQPNISALVNGRLEGFSLERLVRFLVALGCDVEIGVTPSGSVEGSIRVDVGAGTGAE